MLFAVGLMSDPTLLVDYVYQMIISDRLEEMKHKNYYSSGHCDYNLLNSLYTESKVKLPGHPLYNQHINYYDHSENRPIYFPSKMYWFEYVKNDIDLGTKHREQKSEVTECALIISIYTPIKPVNNCQAIMRNQAINYLFVEDVKSTDFPQTFVFNISKHIQ